MPPSAVWRRGLEEFFCILNFLAASRAQQAATNLKGFNSLSCLVFSSSTRWSLSYIWISISIIYIFIFSNREKYSINREQDENSHILGVESTSSSFAGIDQRYRLSIHPLSIVVKTCLEKPWFVKIQGFYHISARIETGVLGLSTVGRSDFIQKSGCHLYALEKVLMFNIFSIYVV